MTADAKLCSVGEKLNRGGADWCVARGSEFWENEGCTTPERDRRISFRRRAPGIAEIEAEVNSSRWILELEAGWDGEGSTSYEKAVWERATGFLLAKAKDLWEKYSRPMDVPRISPGPKGSIDVFWKTSRYQLLLNFPPESKEMATFYGDDYGRNVIRGTVNPEAKNLGFLVWLAELL
jgi:hypothetical protein